MRLFTGIDLPEGIVRRIEMLLQELKPFARIKWSAPENLHVTTKFIGEWPEERLGELTAVLAKAPRTGPIAIAIRTLGFFPNAKSPRVFWAGIDAAPELEALARGTDRVLEPLGVEAEKRGFSPHLTLARIRDPVPLVALRERIDRLASQEFGEFTAGRFYLYQSKLKPSGSVYTKLSEFALDQ
jgi:2'-5' RNA ligase